MKITLNEQPLEITAPITVAKLLSQLKLDQPGTALAINHTIIPCHTWQTHAVQDDDDILLFQAIAGG